MDDLGKVIDEVSLGAENRCSVADDDQLDDKPARIWTTKPYHPSQTLDNIPSDAMLQQEVMPIHMTS